MSEYTATTEEVREKYAEPWANARQRRFPHSSQFDRWLASVKAEAWDEGHDSGWESRHEDALAGFMPSGPHESDAQNPYREAAE
jgi:hypothetical protein